MSSGSVLRKPLALTMVLALILALGVIALRSPARAEVSRDQAALLPMKALKGV